MARALEAEEVALPKCYPRGKCPTCRGSGFDRQPWVPYDGLEPSMVQVRCQDCGTVYYLAIPPPAFDFRRGVFLKK